MCPLVAELKAKYNFESKFINYLCQGPFVETLKKNIKNGLDQWKIAPETLEIHNIGSFQLLTVALWWQIIGWKIFLNQNQLITHVWVHFQKVWKKNIKNQRRLVENSPEGIEAIWYRLLWAASERPLVIDFGKKNFFPSNIHKNPPPYQFWWL